MSSPKILSDNKTTIQELPRFTGTEIKSSTLFDLSSSQSNNSRKCNIDTLCQKEELYKAAAKRYKIDDIHTFDIFTGTDQGDYKPVVFESNPNRAYDLNSEIDADSNRIITKKELDNLENTLSMSSRYPCSLIPAYNWENESGTLESSNYIPVEHKITSFITTNANEERATYKFEYNNRVSNIVNLSRIKLPEFETVKGTFFYNVIGIVSIKTTLKDQKSGTIYLEARDPINQNTESGWFVVDSAVFKFINDSNKSSPGTYITLSGYISTNLETRLKLNLSPQGYSMNLANYRLNGGAFVTNYTNTFVGFAYLPTNNDSNYKIVDDNIYYQVNYDPPGGGIIVPWDRFEDKYLDAGSYIVLGSQGTSSESVPKYRHVRWKNVTTSSPEYNQTYTFGQELNLNPSLCRQSGTIYYLDLKAVYNEIFYDVIYQHGPYAKWEPIIDSKKSPGDYKLMGQVSPGYVTYGGEKYRHYGWKDVTFGSNGKIYNFGTTVVLSENTTRVDPTRPTEPTAYKQFVLEALYKKARYAIQYIPGEATDSESGSWSSFIDYGPDSSGYKEGSVQLLSKRPNITIGTTTKSHVGWKITVNNVAREYEPGQTIQINDDFVLPDDRKPEVSPWIIKATAIYKIPYKVILMPNGGRWTDNNSTSEKIINNPSNPYKAPLETSIKYGNVMNAAYWICKSSSDGTSFPYGARVDCGEAKYHGYTDPEIPTILDNDSTAAIAGSDQRKYVLKAAYANKYIPLSGKGYLIKQITLNNYQPHTGNWSASYAVPSGLLGGYNGQKIQITIHIYNMAQNNNGDNWAAAGPSAIGLNGVMRPTGYSYFYINPNTNSWAGGGGWTETITRADDGKYYMWVNARAFDSHIQIYIKDITLIAPSV